MVDATRKETFEELSDKQKEIVDTHIENPEMSNTNIAEEVGTDDSWVSVTLNEYSDIVEEREEVLLNGRAEANGQVSETLNTLDELFEGDDEIQTIDERPVEGAEEQESGEAEEEPEETDTSDGERNLFSVTVELTEEEMEKVVRHGNPEAVMGSVYDAILEELM